MMKDKIEKFLLRQGLIYNINRVRD